ncbi:hypothetical protein GCM10009868_38120 [Terrabacter aerolatus]|uniref:Uncharacterized protein n=1 Tax=Terrabacter aerolatus TaxID=422442 RepID=A0A512CVH6_9MICO|nr:hypothetical protein TAE01_00150 [Terrabacter aerolatus]
MVSRAALRANGISAADVRAEVQAGRWTTHGLQTVALHTRPLGPDEQLWRALWETGTDVAALDGVTALLAAAIRAAHWADSDRQAALLLVLPTQQGLVRAADLLQTARSLGTHARPRRAAPEPRDAVERHGPAHPQRGPPAARGRLHGPGRAGASAARWSEVIH